MKTLTLLRHAKSSWKEPELKDFDRPLNKRGKHDAPEMAARFARRGDKPDLILSSPAKRTRETIRHFVSALGLPPESVQFEDWIYMAAASELLDCVRRLPDEHDHVLLCGHNPGLTDVAPWLADVVIDNIPTAGTFQVRFPVEQWAETDGRRGELVFFDYPKRATESA